ncbi:MAG: TonB-dependent receptor [Rhodanobacteraceae bacterium]
MRGVALAVFAALAALPASAATLSGRVTDASGEVGFKGAEVRIDELGRSVVTDSDGHFRIDGVPSGRYTLTATYIGAAPATQPVDIGDADASIALAIGADVHKLDNVLVVGYAAGQAAALSQQRNADNFRNVVSSDAVGQFPDQNVTEAIQRVPAVSVTRDQGEGRFIVVRGIDPNLNAISIGGVRVPSAESDSRQVALDVIPSELLSSIEVSKTLTPDRDGDGIGAAIDIKTLSAFDRGNGPSATLKVEEGYNEHRERWSPKVAGSLTDTFSVGDGENNLGIAFGGSWQNRFLATDGIETNGWDRVEGADGNEYLAPKRIEERAYTVDRRRESATFNVDWNVDGATTLYLHSLWSDFRDQEQRQAMQYNFDDGEPETLSNDAGIFTGATIARTIKLREETQRIQSYAFGGETLADLWTFDYELAFSKADEVNPGEIEGSFEGEHDIGYSGAQNPRPHPYPLDADSAQDPSTYALDEMSIADSDTEDREKSVRADVRRDFALTDGAAYVKFGAKLRRREKFADESSLDYDVEGPTLADFGPHRVDYEFGDFGPGWTPRPVRDYVYAGLPGAELNDEDTLVDSLAGDYSADEDIDAGYFMGGYDGGRWHFNGGVRAERTRFDAAGTAVLFDDADDAPVFDPIRATHDYTDVLPQFNARYDLDDNMGLRAALTRSIARANFADLSPGSQIEVSRNDDGSVDERTLVTGNPLLNPYRSDNFDFAWEYYPGGLGAISAGVFLKHIRDFVVHANLAGTGDYIGYDQADVPVNGDSAKLYGVELSWTRQFSWLPEPFDGFLVNANGMWAHSTAHLALRDGSIPLPNQSNVVANLVLGYEKGPWSLRLANSYRSKRLTDLDDPVDATQDIYERAHLEVDFSAKYRFAKDWRVYLEAVNLTDRPFYRQYANGGLAQYEKYGRVYMIGIEANL